MELRPRLPSLGNTLTSLERIRPCDTRFLASEAVEGTSLAFQGVDDNHGCGSLSLGMLGVGDGITDDVLKEDLQNTTGLFVDET